MEFTKTTLGDISIGKGQYGIGASAVDYSEELYTYLRITDINDDGTLNMSDLKSVDDEKAKQYVLKPNDIVFARTGNSTGRNYFYDGTDGIFVYAGFLIKFSIDPSKVNPKYIKYYCLSDAYKGWIQGHSTGSTRGNINAQTYANMEITLPSREQQDKLVSLLEDLELKRKNNVAINRNLSEQVAAIYKAWFVDFETNNGICPDDWKEAILGDIAEIASGKRPPMKQNDKTDDVCIPLVGAASIMGYTNDVLYDSKILVTGRVGTHGVVQRFNQACWPSDNTLVITTDRYEFVNQILVGVDYKSMNRGSTQPLITQGDLKKMEIILPNDAILDEFENLAGGLMNQYEKNVKENANLSELRDTLLPKLMLGELDVSKINF